MERNARGRTRAEEERPYLRRRGRRKPGPVDLAERRLCDLRAPSAKPPWQLAGAGSVGAQVITGIPRLMALRNAKGLRRQAKIWPFETGLTAERETPVILAEVYPSIVRPLDETGMPKDARQVRTVAEHLAALDTEDDLAPLFAADPALSRSERRIVEREEAWILGVTDGLPPEQRSRYVRK